MEKLLVVLSWIATSYNNTVPVFNDCKHFLVYGIEGELIQTESVLCRSYKTDICLAINCLTANLIGRMELSIQIWAKFE